MIADQINDLGCTTVITQDECWRHGRTVPLREAVDEALVTCPSVTNVIVTRRTATPINWVDGRDHWYHEIVANQSAECDPEPMDAEDPLFVLYTSGTTSKPKGILHEGAPWNPRQGPHLGHHRAVRRDHSRHLAHRNQHIHEVGGPVPTAARPHVS